jgi:hypothetical protein
MRSGSRRISRRRRALRTARVLPLTINDLRRGRQLSDNAILIRLDESGLASTTSAMSGARMGVMGSQEESKTPIMLPRHAEQGAGHTKR